MHFSVKNRDYDSTIIKNYLLQLFYELTRIVRSFPTTSTFSGHICIINQDKFIHHIKYSNLISPEYFTSKGKLPQYTHYVRNVLIFFIKNL
jgi:hypothetical protein